MVLVYRMQVLKEVLRIISDMVYSIYLKFVLISGILTLFINIALIITKGHVTRGNFFLQLATQRRFKLHFTREIASCNASSLQNNPTAGHTTTCICLQFYRSLRYLFSPKFALQVAKVVLIC